MRGWHWLAVAFLLLGVAKFAHSMGWIGPQHAAHAAGEWRR